MKPLKIGDKVTATAAFHRTCSHRFNRPGGYKSPEPWKLTPLRNSFTGFIVGKRSVIMSEFVYHHGSNTHDDYEQSYVTGTKESVWLVTESINRDPLIVRDCDII